MGAGLGHGFQHDGLRRIGLYAVVDGKVDLGAVHGGECGVEQVRAGDARIGDQEDAGSKVAPRDVPKIIRIVDQAALVTALAFALGNPDLEPSAEHILANLSQRMAQSLRNWAGAAA